MKLGSKLVMIFSMFSLSLMAQSSPYGELLLVKSKISESVQVYKNNSGYVVKIESLNSNRENSLGVDLGVIEKDSGLYDFVARFSFDECQIVNELFVCEGETFKTNINNKIIQMQYQRIELVKITDVNDKISFMASISLTSKEGMIHTGEIISGL